MTSATIAMTVPAWFVPLRYRGDMFFGLPVDPA